MKSNRVLKIFKHSLKNLNLNQLKNELNTKFSHIPLNVIRTVNTKKNGVGFVCPTEEDREHLIGVLKQVNGNEQEIQLEMPTLKKPRVKLLNVDFFGEKVSSKDLITHLKMNNEWLSLDKEIEHIATIPANWKGIFTKKNNDKLLHHVVFSVGVKTYRMMMELKKVNFKFKHCKVVDGTHIPRCSKCYGLFHKKENCKYKKKLCARCGYDVHEKKDCGLPMQDVRCKHCVYYNQKNNIVRYREIENHMISDKKCPIYQRALKATKQQIQM